MRSFATIFLLIGTAALGAGLSSLPAAAEQAPQATPTPEASPSDPMLPEGGVPGYLPAPGHQLSGTEATPGEPSSLPLNKFQALVDGKTLYFTLPNGSFWAREWYEPGSNRTVIQMNSGECIEGHWELHGNRYCYFYREQPSCWLTHYEADRLKVVSRTGSVQYVDKITDNEPLSCELPPVSQLQQPATPSGIRP
ncbi:MAG: hypothetical protein MRY63_13790 [Neomegalonema sp.]|nr:hypothetical protein [Neomegalonema sp.]